MRAFCAVPETAADTAAETAAETTADTAADTDVATAAAGGVVIEEEEVAPEQMEVVGPQTAATGALPQTGHSGSVLTLLGLAMVASGAAARYAARD